MELIQVRLVTKSNFLAIIWAELSTGQMPLHYHQSINGT